MMNSVYVMLVKKIVSPKRPRFARDTFLVTIRRRMSRYNVLKKISRVEIVLLHRFIVTFFSIRGSKSIQFVGEYLKTRCCSLLCS